MIFVAVREEGLRSIHSADGKTKRKNAVLFVQSPSDFSQFAPGEFILNIAGIQSGCWFKQ